MQVTVAPGATVVAGQLIALRSSFDAGAVMVSETPSPVRVTLPVLVAAKE